jgi:hypothetical protein
VKLLVEDKLGMEKPTTRPSEDCTFSNITGTESYAPYYYTACNKGWISGDATIIKVDPLGTYTKAEVSKLAYAVYSVADYSPSTASFTDVSSSSTYYKYIESLNHAGAFSSTSGTFGPDDTVTDRGGLRAFGPELNQIGSKADPGWLFEWLKNPARLSPTTRICSTEYPTVLTGE